jgi:hypothetical protein
MGVTPLSSAGLHILVLAQVDRQGAGLELGPEG